MVFFKNGDTRKQDVAPLNQGSAQTQGKFHLPSIGYDRIKRIIFIFSFALENNPATAHFQLFISIIKKSCAEKIGLSRRRIPLSAKSSPMS